MTFEEFKLRVEEEGLEYTICNYYPKEDLETIEDREIRDAVLQIAKLTQTVYEKLDIWYSEN
jgi:hypothetical protein